jgi:6-pyruvoyltetrahydropterin/6-carboxytetrahydropterin synthase
LAVRFEFEADSLDERNWVVDFGSFEGVKQFLREHFDHKLLVAVDDPQRETFEALDNLGLADVVVVPATGCEKFAELIYKFTRHWLVQQHGHRVRLVSVEVKEHGANSAIYMGVDS